VRSSSSAVSTQVNSAVAEPELVSASQSSYGFASPSTFVGSAVGSGVGAAVGDAVGAAVGFGVGAAVGDAVGAAVGVAVGSDVRQDGHPLQASMPHIRSSGTFSQKPKHFAPSGVGAGVGIPAQSSQPEHAFFLHLLSQSSSKLGQNGAQSALPASRATSVIF